MTINWKVEQDKFMEVAFHRCERAARRAFKRWHSRKKDDAVQEAQKLLAADPKSYQA